MKTEGKTRAVELTGETAREMEERESDRLDGNRRGGGCLCGEGREEECGFRRGKDGGGVGWKEEWEMRNEPRSTGIFGCRRRRVNFEKVGSEDSSEKEIARKKAQKAFEQLATQAMEGRGVSDKLMETMAFMGVEERERKRKGKREKREKRERRERREREQERKQERKERKEGKKERRKKEREERKRKKGNRRKKKKEKLCEESTPEVFRKMDIEVGKADIEKMVEEDQEDRNEEKGGVIKKRIRTKYIPRREAFSTL